MQFRNCCFTSFDILSPPVFDESKMSYLIYQEEECPDTKKHHFQGYVEFKDRVRLTTLKALLGKTTHVEKRKGTAKQASDYCSKEESRVSGPFIFGTISKQGKRTDLDDVSDEIKANSSLKEIASAHPSTFIKYHRGIERLVAVLDPPKERLRPELYLIHGPPGVGKSRWVRANYPDAYYAKDTEQGWFDGYDKQKVVVFDEFRGHFPRYEMYQLLDYQPLRLPVKGGFVTVHANVFVFTSNTHPREWYNYDDPWIRRLSDFTIFQSSDGIVLPVTSVSQTSDSAPPANYGLQERTGTLYEHFMD